MEETFVYKCPSCGGKVSYLKDDHKWHCEYCKNTYESLFAQEEINLPEFKDLQVTLYSYDCQNCNKKFVSKKKSNAACTYCSHVEEKDGEPFVASGIVDLFYSKKDAERIFLEGTREFNNIEFNKDLKLQYINCDLYNGCVVVSYNNIVEKYIFVNLLIPNIEYEDYRFMYEVGNIGFADSFVLSDKKEEILEEKIILSGKDINSFVNKNFEQDIIDECVKSFAKKYSLSNKASIKADNYFKIKDGFYIPVYISKSIINNDDCYQYVFGSNKMTKNNDSFRFSNKNGYIIELPKEKGSRLKTKYYLSWSGTLYVLTFISVAVFMISLIALLSNNQNIVFSFLRPIYETDGMPGILTAFSISLGIIFFILNQKCQKKVNYYESTIKLSKEEYFNQIINNSNYVKVIRVKK